MYSCHGNHVLLMRTKFRLHSKFKRSEDVVKIKVPEAICCCIQTCIVVFLILVTEYIMHTHITPTICKLH